MSKLLFKDRPIIITDIETTGLDPYRHEIIEIGAIKVDSDLNEIERFSLKVYPRYIGLAEPIALQINGYDHTLWIAEALSQIEAARRFRDFSVDGVLAAWNITFEYNFIDRMFRDTGLSNLMDYHRIDLPSIAWIKLPGLPKVSLDYIAEMAGLPPEPKPHRGIVGAEYELCVLRFLKGIR